MGYCTHCNFDLHAHVIGEKCPECGRVIQKILPRPLPGLLVGVTAQVFVLLPPMVWIAGDRNGSFYALCAALATIPFLFVLAVIQQRRWRHGKLSIGFSLAATLSPALTLVFFVIVFIIGRSSNVAQFASSSGFDYWGLWMKVWPLLLVGTSPCILFALVALICPPYRMRFVASWALPIAALIAALAAMDILARYFPTA